VEFRSYNPAASGDPNKIIWPLRNHIWGTSGPKLAHDIGQTISDAKIRPRRRNLWVPASVSEPSR